MGRRSTVPRAPRTPPEQTRRVQAGALRVSIAADHCVGCLACADVCRPDALALLPDVWAVGVDIGRCTGCRRCEKACPFGVLQVTGATRNRHQVVVDNLRDALASDCPAGWRVSTTGPAFWTALGRPTVVPDLAVVHDDRAAEGAAAGAAVPGPPHDGTAVALVVEVVAPSTRDLGPGRRRDLYWQRDVPTYWTVDQRTGRVTVQWALRPAWFDRWAAFSFA
jgi:ferredoxin